MLDFRLSVGRIRYDIDALVAFELMNDALLTKLKLKSDTYISTKDIKSKIFSHNLDSVERRLF